jgi:hypothetical protein
MARPNSKAKLGQGGRFAALKAKIAKRGGVTNPGAVAAAIGRKKYGKAKFQSMAAKGRKSAYAKGHPSAWQG